MNRMRNTSSRVPRGLVLAACLVVSAGAMADECAAGKADSNALMNA